MYLFMKKISKALILSLLLITTQVDASSQATLQTKKRTSDMAQLNANPEIDRLSYNSLHKLVQRQKRTIEQLREDIIDMTTAGKQCLREYKEELALATASAEIGQVQIAMLNAVNSNLLEQNSQLIAMQQIREIEEIVKLNNTGSEE